ncbi:MULTISPECIES: diacylglycerol/lipid kinase family protein [Bacteroidota]|jgi:YegS/Rv2252/BmrU family lipid kinase|uniref:Diacylglycerol kinase family lipid kinase n=1 Tax=Flectobacillus rivi TaxID=2984209 RepID=A0ABT6YZW0_9BACT|nr:MULTISPECIES: diacylglycerol kinase family protein [Bacteroidota]MDI9874415.1 diacylglycerol kinase family lipid kinase [Flectobacillus rivi]NBB26808.1 YegS/Rv2252/BmrU family lipid kinase [Cellulophaga sp. BC115SP]
MIWFVLNPKSGTTTPAKRNKIIQAINKQANCRLILTEYAGHATEIAQQAVQQGISRVVAVGGDGTVNEVARGLVGSDTALGIIPIGSGNGLARHLNIPLKIDKAIQFAIQQPTAQIDACYLNEIPFFCTAGVGFDAFVANEFAQQESRGLKTYAKMSLKSFRTYKPEAYVISHQGKDYAKMAFSITFANATQYGNNALISPKSKIDDGLIDLVVLKPFPFGAAPIIGVRLFRGTLPNSRYIDMEVSEDYVLKSEKPLLIHFDGEPLQLDTNEIRVYIKPKSLKVVAGVVE